jgi:hypothetical protein
MNRSGVIWAAGAVAAAGVAVATVVNRRRLPRVWIGLYLEDGMFIPLGKGEPEAPELRARAGDVIRALTPAPTVEGDV